MLYRTKLLRLIHVDICCGTKMKHFGMTDNKIFGKCFEVENINHLLLQCPYNKKYVLEWGLHLTRPENILHGSLISIEHEIRTDIIGPLVIRKQHNRQTC